MLDKCRDYKVYFDGLAVWEEIQIQIKHPQKHNIADKEIKTAAMGDRQRPHLKISLTITSLPNNRPQLPKHLLTQLKIPTTAAVIPKLARHKQVQTHPVLSPTKPNKVLLTKQKQSITTRTHNRMYCYDIFLM